MITEDYVSFETAKLLKESGFNEDTNYHYGNDKVLYGEDDIKLNNYDLESNGYNGFSAPTLQMAMKWLREVHNLHIEVYRTACGYLYIISKVPTGSDIYDNGDAYDGDDEDSGQWSTYEKACEAAIKYCLKI